MILYTSECNENSPAVIMVTVMALRKNITTMVMIKIITTMLMMAKLLLMLLLMMMTMILHPKL